jgi:hypothetical protein
MNKEYPIISMITVVTILLTYFLCGMLTSYLLGI